MVKRAKKLDWKSGHLLNHVERVINVYHLTLTLTQEDACSKSLLYSQPFYDPFQLRKEYSQPFYGITVSHSIN